MIGDHPAELRIYKFGGNKNSKDELLLFSSRLVFFCVFVNLRFRFFGGQKNEKYKSKKVSPNLILIKWILPF